MVTTRAPETKEMDTRSLMIWDSTGQRPGFIQVIEKEGFQVVSTRTFEQPQDRPEPIDQSQDEVEAVENPVCLVAAHFRRKLVMVANSFIYEGGPRLHTGHVYGVIAPRVGRTQQEAWRLLSQHLTCPEVIKAPEQAIAFGCYVGNTLVTSLKTIESRSAFVNWGHLKDNRPENWPSLLDPMEERCSDMVEKARIRRVRWQEFLDNAPSQVRDFVS